VKLLLFVALTLAVFAGPATAVPAALASSSFGASQTLEVQTLPAQQENPESEGDQATVNWQGVLIPLIVVLAIIFVVGLFLMRIWHWIDPT
jgi:hypothetical protein